MKQAVSGVLAIFGLLAFGAWLTFLALHGSVDVLSPAGSIADQQRDLIIFTLILSAVVVVPVFILLFSFAYRYRASNNKAQYQPEWAENRKLELLWWGIPILIIGVLAVVAWQTSHSLDPYKKLASTNNTPVEVEVVALQWKWLFIYPQYDSAFVNHLPMPLDTPFEFKITADAPMSAFWVPALGSQIYAMNGMTSELNLIVSEPGIYKGYSTNINGEGYADMVFDVRATDRKEFDETIAKARSSGQVLDIDEYEKLAKASILKETTVYSVSDPDLYSRITSKYMGSMSDRDSLEVHSHSGMHDMKEMD